MDLILILGPMKSGKSSDLIRYFKLLSLTDVPFVLYHSQKNIRDKNICSRDGVFLEAQKISNFSEIPENKFKVIGIDELHMFTEDNVVDLEKLLKGGTKILVAGLDLDYKGETFPIVKKLLALNPQKVKYKKAICDICKNPEATHTQIYNGTALVLSDIPSVVPDDGTYIYKAVCRNCFVKK